MVLGNFGGKVHRLRTTALGGRRLTVGRTLVTPES